MDARSPLLQVVQPIVDSLKNAHLYVNNNSSMVVVEGEISQIMNLPQKLVPLGYRLKGGITFRYHGRTGKALSAIATFLHERAFKELTNTSEQPE
jgi:hypothetical protein